MIPLFEKRRPAVTVEAGIEARDRGAGAAGEPPWKWKYWVLQPCDGGPVDLLDQDVLCVS